MSETPKHTCGVRELSPAANSGGNKGTLEPHSIWPHAPTHRLTETGVYMVTAGTYQKTPLFHDDRALRMLQTALLTIAAKYAWHLQAWAILTNHYHFIAAAPADANTLTPLIRELH